MNPPNVAQAVKYGLQTYIVDEAEGLTDWQKNISLSAGEEITQITIHRLQTLESQFAS